jgi:undecaprenyl-diphosphatase
MDGRPARRDPWPWVGLGCALAFAVLAALVVRGASFPLDASLTDVVQGLPVPTWLWVACTELGGDVRGPIGIALVGGALFSRRFRLALVVAVILVVATLFTDLVKDAVARPRPPGEALVPTTGYSFPSGHALGSAVTYGLLALVAWRSPATPRVRRAAAVAGVTIPCLVGLSRVALGVHYPTDVLGGWLAGTAFVAVPAIVIGATGAMEPDRSGRATEDPAPGPGPAPFP